MNFIIRYFNNSISLKTLILFLPVYIFSIFLTYKITKGFISNVELSDFTFFFLIIGLIEFIFFSFKNFFNNLIEKNYNYFLYVNLFLLSYLIWSSDSIHSYKDFLIYTIFFYGFSYFLYFNFKTEYKNNFNLNNKDIILLIFISTIYLSGLIYNLSFSNIDNLLIYIISLIIIFSLNYILEKNYSKINLILSIIIFLILFKVFIISSNKDAFHYAWYLGPINSLFNYNLYEQVVSQYGFLNLLSIYTLSTITKLNTVLTLFIFIAFLIIIFFLILNNKLSKLIEIPLPVITLFSCLLVFGNIGYSNLSGAIFIPSSSVFRFLPSLLTIILFSEYIKKKNKNNFIYLASFLIFFIISLLWSFESFFFTLAPIIIFLIYDIIIQYNKKLQNFYSNNFKTNFSFKRILFILVLFFFPIFFLLKEKSIISFYEYALFTTGSLSEGIINNNLTLSFIFFIFVSYFFLRDSFKNIIFFKHNLLFFVLFLSFSIYFLNRSVDNNIISLLPFFIFIIVNMKVLSKHTIYFRKIIILIIIFFSISSSFVSISLNYKVFKNNLFSKELVLPMFKSSNYIPSNKTLNIILNYNLPVTLISEEIIHYKNKNLPFYGYGMPILPLEMFSLLNDKRRNFLYDTFFIKNKSHLILCTVTCNFFRESSDSNIRNKIFIGEKYKYSKISEVNINEYKETLFLISKKR